jgi:hypothetical protein
MKARCNSPYTSHTPFPCAHQSVTAHHSRHRHAHRARPARAQTCVCDRCMWQVCERAQYQSGRWGLLLGSWAHRASHSSGSGDEVHGMHHMAGARVGPFRGLQASLAAYNAVQGSGLGMSTAGSLVWRCHTPWWWSEQPSGTALVAAACCCSAVHAGCWAGAAAELAPASRKCVSAHDRPCWRLRRCR